MERIIYAAFLSILHVLITKGSGESVVTKNQTKITNVEKTDCLSKTRSNQQQITDFKEFMENHQKLYVDKTLFLPDFISREEKHKGPIVLVTKPPGFGKSLMASTVDYFFNSKYDLSQSKRLFSGLNVMAKTSTMNEFRAKHMNRYPVIKISFGSFEATNYQNALKEIGQIFKQVIEDHTTVTTNYDDPIFTRITNGNADKKTLLEFVPLLCGCVANDTDPILIIDAYDTPLTSAYAAAYYSKMAEFIAKFFEEIFNDGYYRFSKMLITGVSTVEFEFVHLRKEGTEAKPHHYNPLARFFGFTEEEVVALLARNGKSKDNQRTLVENFGGYGFRDFNGRMLNPSGVIGFFDKSACTPGVSINPASTTILKDLLKIRKDGFLVYPMLSLQKLLANESFSRRVIERLDYSSLCESSPHFTNFLMSFGLATKEMDPAPDISEICPKPRDPNKVQLKIPNLTVRKILAPILTEVPEALNYTSLTNSLIDGDFERALIMFRTFMKNASSFVIIGDKESNKKARVRKPVLCDYARDLLQGVLIKYNTDIMTLHLPGFDYIELEPSKGYTYRIRVRIEKTNMVKAAWIRVRNKVYSMVRTVPKKRAEIFIQYGKSFVDVFLRPMQSEYRLSLDDDPWLMY
nr:PREDICTED: uncharacterized protein LOC109037739 [Bemisia tabaci]